MDRLVYLIPFAVAAALLVAGALVWRRNREASLVRLLAEQWGAAPERGVSADQLSDIRANAVRLMPFAVDSITWNDLEIDRLYRALAATQSSAGDHMLYALLRNPCLTAEELARRTDVMDWAAADASRRERVKRLLYDLGRQKNLDLALMLDHSWYDAHRFYLFCGLDGALVLFLILGIAGISAGWAGFALLAVANTFISLRMRKQIGMVMATIGYLPRLVHVARALGGEGLALPDGLRTEISRSYQVVGKIATTWITAVNTENINVLAGDITDFLRSPLLMDSISFYHLTRMVRDHREELRHLYALVGQVDALIAAASWRQSLPQSCQPELGEDYPLAFEELVHPMLPGAVPNSAAFARNVLLTGSNASGKSTFLKAVALNALLAQALGVATAEKWRGRFCRVYTSMALRDNLFEGESYFIAEIRSLKRILDARQGTPLVLCIIDEVLRGTNTGERIAAAAQVLGELGRGDGVCLAATHDGELTGLLGQWYENYHFSETIIDGDVSFDYQLHAGPAVGRNAIALLDMLGFDTQIVEQARIRLQTFEQTGVWA